MYIFLSANQFNKEYKKIKESGQKDMKKINDVMQTLIAGASLPVKNKDHALSNNYKGRRECHIEPDWLLIYKIDNDTIIFPAFVKLCPTRTAQRLPPFEPAGCTAAIFYLNII